MRSISLSWCLSVAFPLLLGCTNGFAQQGDLIVLRFHATAAVDGMHEKRAMEALTALDPTARLSIHADRQHLKVGLKHAVDAEIVRTALLEAGIQAWLLPDQMAPEGGAKVSGSGPNGFPVFISTGNPELDNENYNAAKASWIQEHPQAYQELLNAAMEH